MIGDNISFNSCEILNNKLYFASNFENVISTFDMKDNQVRYLDRIDCFNQNILLGGADKIVKYNEKLFIFELAGRKVVQYDTKKNKCKTIFIDCNIKDWQNFAAIVENKGNIYAFPQYGDKYVQIDCITGKVSCEKELYALQKNVGKDRKVFSCGCLADNIVWLFRELDKKIVQYDLVKKKYQEYTLSIDISECIDIVYADKSLYFLDDFGRVIRWNIKENKTELLLDSQNGNMIFGRLIVIGNKVWLLPDIGNDICILNLTDRSFSIYERYPEDFFYEKIDGWGKYYDYCKDEENYYIAMRLSNYMLCINRKTGEEQWKKPIMPLPEEKVEQWVKNQYIFNESAFSLRKFIKGLKNN